MTRRSPVAVASLPARAKAPPKKAAWAEILFEHIPSIGDNPKSLAQCAHDANLTPWQVRQAVEYLRDTYPEFPLISSHEGYQFSIDADTVQTFRRARVRSALTLIRRTWDGAIHPYLNHVNDPLVAQVLTKQYKRVMEDLTELVR